MSLQVIFLSVLLSLFCFGNSFTITGSKDAEYEGVDYQDVEIASSGTECYFKAALKGCKKGKKLNTEFTDATKDEKEFTTVVESTSAACLEARCTQALALSRPVEIGGEGESAQPGELKKGYSTGLYKSRAECMKSGSAVVNIKCKPTRTDVNSETGKPNTEIEMEEYDPATDVNSETDETNTEIEMEEYDPEIPSDNVIEDIDAEMMQAPAESAQDSVIPDGEHSAKIAEHVGDHNEADDKEEEYRILAMMKEDENGTTAKMQWNNWYRGTLYVRAPNRGGLAHVRSYHSNCYEDRVFQLYYRSMSRYNFNHCYWTGYRNHFDGVLNARCARSYMLNGIYSTYSYHHRDRRFSFLCCRAPRCYVRSCNQYLSGFVNNWDAYMNYGVGSGYAFTGAYSYHDNGREDRRWRIYYSYFRNY